MDYEEIELMRLSRILKSLWPWRWWNCLHALAGGARVHPSVCLLGSTTRIRLGHGSSIGVRSRLDAGSVGQIVLGERVWASSDFEIETNSKVHIGEGTTIQRRCTINGSTRIGAGCIFAPNVFVSSGTHPFRIQPHLPIREQEKRLMASIKGIEAIDRPIWIQDDCWLGANVVVCPGVTIGKGSVIGANCVVTRDVAPYAVVAGVPAKTIGQRLEWNPRNSISADQQPDHPYILSGKLVNATTEKPAYIEASLETPICVALSVDRPDAEFTFEWYAPASVRVEIGGSILSLPAGRGQHKAVRMPEKIVGGIHYYIVAVGGPSTSAVLRITYFSIV